MPYRHLSPSPPVSGIRVVDVIRLALPPATRLVAGARGVERLVTWARVLRARPFSLGSVEPGEFVIIAGVGPTGWLQPRDLARLIGDLAEREVSGFAVVGEVRELAIVAADEAGAPLLQLPPETSANEVERAVVGLIVDREARLRERCDEIARNLTELALADRGLAAITQALADAAGLAVSVHDEYLQTLALTTPSRQPVTLSAAAVEQALRRELLEAHWLRSGVLAGTMPPVRRLSLGLGLGESLVAPIVIKGTVAGYLVCTVLDDQGDDLAEQLTARAAAVCAIDLAKQRAVIEAQIRLQGDFLDDLFAGEYATEEAMLARARYLGYDLLAPHAVMVFGLDPPSDGVTRLDPAQVGRPRRRLIDVIRRELGEGGLGSWPSGGVAPAVREHGESVALLQALGEHEGPARARDLAEGLRQRAGRALGGASLTAGVGRPARGVAATTVAYREAEQALTIGQRLLGGGRTVYFGNLGVHRLLFHLRDQPDLTAFYHELLGALVEYDRRHNAELVKTLEAFFACNGNNVRTAEMLHLHRNTLLYRLERIRDITGLDLDEPETRLSLQVALRIGQILASGSGRTSA